mgnify:CR=1 FL=1
MSKELLNDLKRKLNEAVQENEQLKWKIGSELVDLREENEQIRKKFNELSELSMELVDRCYYDEEKHYEETIDEDGEGGEGHTFHTIIKIQKLTN